jgi:hypothetical protein
MSPPRCCRRDFILADGHAYAGHGRVVERLAFFGYVKPPAGARCLNVGCGMGVLQIERSVKFFGETDFAACCRVIPREKGPELRQSKMRMKP